MDRIYRVGKRLLTILLSAALSFVFLACQLGKPNSTDITENPQAGVTPIPTLEQQTDDALSETTPFGNESESVQTSKPDVADTDTEEKTDTEATEQTNGTGAYTITADTRESGKRYVSEAADENAMRVENKCTVSVHAATVEKLLGDATNNAASGSRGLNAAMLLYDGAQLTLSGSNITSDALGAAGVFAYGADAYLIIEDSGIRTNGDDSSGIVAADGAIIAAKSLIVSTQGADSPAIQTTQTGGSISVTGGTFTTGGVQSPAAYVKGSVSAQDAALRANHSAAITVESGGSVTLNNCTVSGNMPRTSDDGDVNPYTVLLCQSESDAKSDSKGAFIMTGGQLNANNGDLFFVTGGSDIISLTNVTLSVNNGALLRMAVNDSQSGSECNLVASSQILIGDILVDSRSMFSLALSNGTSYTGSINPDGTNGDATVSIDGDSTWTLTSDAYLTEFSGKTKNIETNGYTVFVNGDAIT